MASSPYPELCSRLQHLAMVSSVEAVLGWDQETHLPAAATAHRAAQLSWLAGHVHALATDSDLKRLVQRASKGANAVQQANLRVIEREMKRQSALPASLIEEESRAVSLAKASWQRARAKDDFPAFAPHLEALVGFARRKAELWGYPNEPYDALLEGYEPGMTCAQLDNCFGPLQPQLIALAAKAVERCSQAPRVARPTAVYPVALQKQLNAEIAASLGFDFAAGRIDTTAHPFCTTLGPRDIRLTTRYDERDFTSSLFGVLHEAGHGLYEQGLPAKHFGLPSGRACSLSVHESQSRLWENHVGRSEVFWQRWYPRAQELFPALRRLALERFVQSLRRVSYSPIRVEADEATYDLHILLRVELERRLLRGELAVRQVPAAWAELSRQWLGFAPKNDSEGCLQDIHWSMGGIGYFATYTLGNLHAAQLFKAAMSEGSIASAFRRAEFAPLLQWLRTRVHRKGALKTPSALVASASGGGISPEPYLQHLRKRYLGGR